MNFSYLRGKEEEEDEAYRGEAKYSKGTGSGNKFGNNGSRARESLEGKKKSLLADKTSYSGFGECEALRPGESLFDGKKAMKRDPFGGVWWWGQAMARARARGKSAN